MRVWFYRTFLSSLRSRLVLLVLLAVVPALGLILYTASAQRRSASADVQRNLFRLAKFAAVNQKQASEGARQLLVALSQLQDVREGNREDCTLLLSNLLKQYRVYAGFAVFDVQGNTLCSAPTAEQAINVADRSYFQIALKTRDFAIGEYQTGRITGKAIVNFAYPVVESTGQIKAVVVAALDLNWLNQLAAEAQLPPGSVLVVTDRKGTILVRYPDPQQWVGKLFSDAPITKVILAEREGTLKAHDFDGVERLYAFTTLGRDPVNRDVHVRIGIPESVAYVEANHLLIQNLIALGLVTLLAIIAACAGGDAFLIRKMHSLVRTTQQLRAGNLSTRTNLDKDTGEIGVLARAFNEMTAALEKREQSIAALNHDLQNRVNELQTLFEVIPIGILISYDLNFKEIKANPTFAKILGLTSDGNASSTPPQGIAPPSYKLYSKGKELAPDETPLRYAAIHGVEVEGAEVEVKRGDGTLFNLFGYAAPLLDEQGKSRGSVGAFLDITELRQTEEALRVSRERFDLVIQGVELGVWYCDLPFSQLNWNDKCKEHFGLPPDAEVTIDTFYDRIHPDDRKRTKVAIEQSIEEHTQYAIDYRTVAPNGQVRWIRAIGRTFYSEVGHPIRFDGITIDITKQKRFEEELPRSLKAEQVARTEAENANRVKDEFLAVLSHELRTPLNPILGWSKLLRTGNLDEKTATSALEIIERNAKLQTQLIEDLLDVSRILQGKLTLNVASVDLTATIKAAIETVRLAAEAKSIQFHTMLAPAESQVMGDPNRLQQVVWNLLSNAVKFTPEGGQIKIRLSFVTGHSSDVNDRQLKTSNQEQLSNYVQIQVEDTGKGIGAEFLPYVFDTFRQADSTTTRAFGGLGLGLAIARHIVEMHGGTIGVDSPGENLGATFTVKLPLLQPNLKPTQAAQNNPSSITDYRSLLNQVKVLLVDDDLDTRNVVKEILKQQGITVTVAASANEALKILEQTTPDILLCDIAMPDMDGYALIRQLKAPSSNQAKIPAIALTSYATEADQQQALAAGFHLHLSKPVEANNLVKAIVDLVSLQR